MNYIKSNEKVIYNWLKDHLDEQRLLHSIGTARTAADLAKKFGLDDEKAYIAGLLHDCAKCYSKEDILAISKKLNLDQCELDIYKVLHAPVSAFVAETEFGITDPEILASIRWHTLGHISMGPFEKIIFLADKMEPMTRESEFSELIVKLLEDKDGLNRALMLCYKETIRSLLRRDLKICQCTIDIYNSML